MQKAGPKFWPQHKHSSVRNGQHQAHLDICTSPKYTRQNASRVWVIGFVCAQSLKRSTLWVFLTVMMMMMMMCKNSSPFAGICRVYTFRLLGALSHCIGPKRFICQHKIYITINTSTKRGRMFGARRKEEKNRQQICECIP